MQSVQRINKKIAERSGQSGVGFNWARALQLLSLGQKGQVANVIAGTVIGIFVLILIMFASLFAISVLNPSSFFTAGSFNANATNDLTQNFTSGTSQFASRIPTVMVILGAVFALAGIVLLIVYIRRGFAAEAGGAGL